MSSVSTPDSLSQRVVYDRGNDIALRRLAGGAALGELCAAIHNHALPYDEDVDVRTPDEEYNYQPRMEIVDPRSIRMNKLRQRGITRRKLHLGLSHLVPSVLSDETVHATDVDIDYSNTGEYYIALQLSDKDSAKILDERRKIWSVIGTLGEFSIDRVPWLDRHPDIRLAYIPTDPEMPELHDLANTMGDTIRRALPFPVTLEPVFKEALTIPTASS